MPTDYVNVLPLIALGFATRAIKSWQAREGTGYQFTLTHNRKQVAQVTQHGNGGETDIRWLAMYPNGRKLDTATDRAFKASAAAKTAFEAFVAAAEPLESHGMTLEPDAGCVLEEVYNHAQILKACKRKTLFRTQEGQELQINESFNPGLKAWIEKNHPLSPCYARLSRCGYHRLITVSFA